MPTADQQAQIVALQATIATQKRQIDLAATQIAEPGKMMRFDLDRLQASYNDNFAALAMLTGTRRPIRRLLVSTPSRGY